jgi:hypothetical protein
MVYVSSFIVYICWFLVDYVTWVMIYMVSPDVLSMYVPNEA